MAARPKIVLIGGDGGRSGVPRHIGHLCEVLADTAALTVISDRDRGGFGFAGRFDHHQVEGLATSVNPFAAGRAGRQLAEVLTQVQPDLVWAHARMALPLARWAMRGGGLGRLMVTYHGVPFGPGHGLAKSLFSRGIEAVSLRFAPPHDMVFLTEEDRAAMPALAVGRQVHILPNCSWLGATPTLDRLRAGPRRLVMMTRVSAQKNLDLAARVFAALPEDFTLDLHGMGTDAPGLRARFAAVMGPGALRRVGFRGETAEVRGLLAQADGLLVTSRYEGLSIAMIEAMEAGLPVFSTAVGGTALIRSLHPMFGAVTADLIESAATIDALTTQYRASLAEWGGKIHAAWASHFAPDIWAHQVRALVDGVLQRRP